MMWSSFVAIFASAVLFALGTVCLVFGFADEKLRGAGTVASVVIFVICMALSWGALRAAGL